MLNELSERVLREWSRLLPEERKPQRIQYLGLPGSIEGGTTSYLAFSERNDTPLFAVKIHRDPGHGRKALKEESTLSLLANVGGGFGGSVPRVLLCERVSQVWVLVQTILRGTPMLARSGSDGMPDARQASSNFEIASEWLSLLDSGTRDRSEVATRTLREGGLKLLKRFPSLFRLSPPELCYLESLEAALPRVCASGGVIQHGDFCRQNILLSGSSRKRKIGVIDWTDSRTCGFPLHDLFFFLATYFVQVRKETGKAGFLAAFSRTFLEKNQYSREAFRVVDAYCRHHGVVRSEIEPLFVLFLIDRVLFPSRLLGVQLQNGPVEDRNDIRHRENSSDVRTATPAGHL